MRIGFICCFNNDTCNRGSTQSRAKNVQSYEFKCLFFPFVLWMHLHIKYTQFGLWNSLRERKPTMLHATTTTARTAAVYITITTAVATTAWQYRRRLVSCSQTNEMNFGVSKHFVVAFLLFCINLVLVGICVDVCVYICARAYSYLIGAQRISPTDIGALYLCTPNTHRADNYFMRRRKQLTLTTIHPNSMMFGSSLADTFLCLFVAWFVYFNLSLYLKFFVLV